MMLYKRPTRVLTYMDGNNVELVRFAYKIEGLYFFTLFVLAKYDDKFTKSSKSDASWRIQLAGPSLRPNFRGALSREWRREGRQAHESWYYLVHWLANG